MKYLPLFICMLAACETPKVEDTDTGAKSADSGKVIDTDTKDTDSGDTDTAEDTSGTDTEDTGTSGCTAPITLVGVVYYDNYISDISATEDRLIVSLPQASGTKGQVDTWTVSDLESSSILYGDLDSPSTRVTGDASLDYLGVKAWAAFGEESVCSQTYGTGKVGVLSCWPIEYSGSLADSTRKISVSGTDPYAYFGYGTNYGDDVIAWQAAAPGDVYLVSDDGDATLMGTNACDGIGYCHSGLTIGGGLVLASNDGGLYFDNIDDGMLTRSWSLDTVGGGGYPVTLGAWGGAYVYLSSPGAPDDTYLTVYNPNDGSVVSSLDIYISGAVTAPIEGRDVGIVMARWIDFDDESTGGVTLYNARSGEFVSESSWYSLLAARVGYESPDSRVEPFVWLKEMGHGLVAFGTYDGHEAGVIRVCLP